MIEAGEQKNIIWQLFVWHFYEMPKGILIGWRNFLLFNFKYFSVVPLLKTFFSHWRQTKDKYQRGFEPWLYLTTFIGNLMSRLLGALIRLITIVLALICEVFIFAAGIIVLLFWLFLPVIIFFGFSFCAYLIL